MNKWVAFGGIGVVLVAAYLYYRQKTQAVEQAAYVNPGASVNEDIGNIIRGSTYQANTGPVGDTTTSNYRYDEYQQYLQSGGTRSGQSFSQFLTAAQSNSLPVNG